MEKDRIELKVSAIKNGTVIDHIPAKNLFKVINILELDNIDTQVTFGTNFESRKLGKKAIIKISEKFPHDEDINKISLIAPDAKINIIKNYKVVEKKFVSVPEKISAIVKCMNPKCVTNHENVTTKFNVIKNYSIALKCHYCEKITHQEHFEIV